MNYGFGESFKSMGGPADRSSVDHQERRVIVKHHIVWVIALAAEAALGCSSSSNGNGTSDAGQPDTSDSGRDASSGSSGSSTGSSSGSSTGSVSDASPDSSSGASSGSFTDASSGATGDASLKSSTDASSGSSVDASSGGHDGSTGGPSDGGSADATVDADGSDQGPADDGGSDGGGATADGPTGPSPAVQITAGESQVCVLTQHGDAECFGTSLKPTKITTFTSNVAAVSTGGGEGEFNQNPAAAACAITTAGAAWCWGDNAGDELGNGGTNASSVPTPVSGLTSGVTSLSVGVNYAVCAVQSGNVWCWGSASAGVLGNGSATTTPVPVELAGFTGAVVSVAVGVQSACVIIADGSVECWGSNGDGELGNGTKTASLAPVAVTGITSGATAVAVGTNYACAIVSGAVECWGNNGFGATTTPSLVSGLSSGATAISIGDQDTACAVVNGGIQCWGSNQFGFFGNNSTTNSAVPVPVTTLTSGVTAVAVGPSYGFPCAITNSGAVWCWATQAAASVPVRVAGFPQ